MDEGFTETGWKKLGRQLSCPSGELGVKVGENMSQAYIGMMEGSIDSLHKLVKLQYYIEALSYSSVKSFVADDEFM